MIKIIFLGRLSDVFGRHNFQANPPDGVETISKLKQWLEAEFAAQGALTHPSIKTMLDKTLVGDDAKILTANEIGFLPPVGGG